MSRRMAKTFNSRLSGKFLHSATKTSSRSFIQNDKEIDKQRDPVQRSNTRENLNNSLLRLMASKTDLKHESKQGDSPTSTTSKVEEELMKFSRKGTILDPL